jgi:hypothetical protein
MQGPITNAVFVLLLGSLIGCLLDSKEPIHTILKTCRASMRQTAGLLQPTRRRERLSCELWLNDLRTIRSLMRIIIFAVAESVYGSDHGELLYYPSSLR